jgi:hypothetical protein
MKSLSILLVLLALCLHKVGFAQGKPKASAKPTTTTGTTNKTTGTTNTSAPVVVPPPTNNGNSGTSTTTATPSNNSQKNTATSTVGTSNKLGGGSSTVDEARMVCSPITMSYSAFEALKSKVAGIPSDSIKIITIQNEVQGKKLSVSQVRNLLNLLQKNIKRLELAKYLLDYTCNRSQYSTLADMLNANNVKEFNDYINSKNLTDSAQLVRDGN